MPRFARVVLPGVPHHVTQRGNAHRFILQTDIDRLVYLRLLSRYTRLHEVQLLGYCLMSNHVHLIAIPRRGDSLALVLRQTHGQYAAYLNAREGSSGHVWQGRYYSCPLDGRHLWAALRYTELNPVRAGIVERAEVYPWSTAAVHCGVPSSSLPVELAPWEMEWSATSWRDYLGQGESEVDTRALRVHTHTGRPMGSSDFILQAERVLHRRLMPQKCGRPRKRVADAIQCAVPGWGG